jgi:hypothetical protein
MELINFSTARYTTLNVMILNDELRDAYASGRGLL